MTTLQQRIEILSKNLPRGWKRELAAYCGIKQPSVSNWCTGETKTLEGKNLMKAAEFFGCNPMWLAEGKGPRHLTTHTHHHAAETVKEFNPAWPFQCLRPDDWWKHLDEEQRKHIEDSAIFMLPPANRDSYQSSNRSTPEKGKAAGAA